MRLSFIYGWFFFYVKDTFIVLQRLFFTCNQENEEYTSSPEIVNKLCYYEVTRTTESIYKWLV